VLRPGSRVLTVARGRAPMSLMASWYRIAAVATLAALLACSSLGVCWKVFATADAHDCCQRGDGISATSRTPCSSDVTAHGLTKLAPPPVSPAAPYPTVEASAASPEETLLRLVLPPKAPPLVLRI
jgi:hypothetical protein